MNIRTLVMMSALLLAGPVLAGSCPSLIAEFDALVAAGVDVDQDTLDEAIELRNEGEALHQSGDHAESVATLEEALELLQSD